MGCCANDHHSQSLPRCGIKRIPWVHFYHSPARKQLANKHVTLSCARGAELFSPPTADSLLLATLFIHFFLPPCAMHVSGETHSLRSLSRHSLRSLSESTHRTPEALCTCTHPEARGAAFSTRSSPACRGGQCKQGVSGMGESSTLQGKAAA